MYDNSPCLDGHNAGGVDVCESRANRLEDGEGL